MRFIIISGRSGSGKSVCLNILEDFGFYCISNLPLGLLTSLPEQLENAHPEVAISIDARNLEGNSPRYEEIIAELDKKNIRHETIFLDADDKKLLERFSETRRKHPLSNKKTSLQEALRNEQKLLLPIAAQAELRIDTSKLSVSALRDTLRTRVAPEKESLSLLFQSFAYKSGVPRDSDYIFDVRCLPNPYWEPHLRKMTGQEQPIIDFLEAQPPVKLLLTDMIKFLENWIPQHKLNERNYLTVSIGCTGGQHRSVYITEKLYAHFAKTNPLAQLRHLELPTVMGQPVTL